jgi:hypothetical protein
MSVVERISRLAWQTDRDGLAGGIVFGHNPDFGIFLTEQGRAGNKTDIEHFPR